MAQNIYHGFLSPDGLIITGIQMKTMIGMTMTIGMTNVVG